MGAGAEKRAARMRKRFERDGVDLGAAELIAYGEIPEGLWPYLLFGAVWSIISLLDDVIGIPGPFELIALVGFLGLVVLFWIRTERGDAVQVVLTPEQILVQKVDQRGEIDARSAGDVALRLKGMTLSIKEATGDHELKLKQVRFYRPDGHRAERDEIEQAGVELPTAPESNYLYPPQTP